MALATTLTSGSLYLEEFADDPTLVDGDDAGVIYVKTDGGLYYKSHSNSGTDVTETRIDTGGDIDNLSELDATPHATQDEYMISDNGTEKRISVTNAANGAFALVSGDATIAAGGALTIANDAVEQAMIADDAVGADQLASNAVVNASIASNAAIDMDKLDGGSCAAALTDLAQGDLIYAGDVDASNAIKSITFSNLEDAIFGNVSGDAAIAAGGALTIANDAVEQAMIADDAVGADQLAANAVVNASIASNAAIDIDKLDGGSCAATLSDLAQGDLLYAGDVDASNAIKSITFSNLEDAIFGNVSGDATIAAGGALTIAAGAVETGMIADDAITGAKIALFDDSLAATTTHFLIADGTDYSSFALSGDVTCTNGGVVTIANDAVEQAMIADDAVGADQLASNAVVNASVASNAAIAASKVDFNVDLGSNITFGTQANDMVTFTGPIAASAVSGAQGTLGSLDVSSQLYLTTGSAKMTHKLNYAGRATAGASLSGATWDGAFGCFISGGSGYGLSEGSNPYVFAVGVSSSNYQPAVLTNMPMGFAPGIGTAGSKNTTPFMNIYACPADNYGNAAGEAAHNITNKTCASPSVPLP